MGDISGNSATLQLFVMHMSMQAFQGACKCCQPDELTFVAQQYCLPWNELEQPQWFDPARY